VVISGARFGGGASQDGEDEALFAIPTGRSGLSRATMGQHPPGETDGIARPANCGNAGSVRDVARVMISLG
jgi:hypothetical protein